MDEQMRGVLQQMLDLQKSAGKRLNVLEARTTLDHFVMQRLVSKTEILRHLEPWEREELGSIVNSARRMAALLDDAMAINTYIDLILARVDELDGKG